MDSSTWSLIFITAAIFIYIRICRMRYPSSRNFPKGSFGILPLIGETLHFISCAYSETPESFMDKRRRMYGKVFKSHLFGNPTIVSTDAEVSRIILSDSRTFVPCYPKSLSELMGKSSILLINGSLQRRIHGLIGGFLKSAFLKAQVTADMDKYVKESMAEWRDDRPVLIQDEARKIAFQVLVKALISLDGEDKRMESLKKYFQEFIAGLMSIPLKLPGTQLYRSLQAKKKMMTLMDEIIRGKRIRGDDCYGARDVADALINDETLRDDVIAENLIDLMIPGEDSVPLLITLAVKYLSDSPSALRQLIEENMNLKRVKEKRGEAMSWDDYLSQLPFTQNVITETLRLGNIIIGVMRKATRDVEMMNNIFIPKGWSVLAYFRSVHLDPHLYPFPLHFNPWRWQEREINGIIFTPFGGGQRLCPGLELSRLEASVFLHHFVTHFRWEAEEDSIINFPTVRLKRRMPVWVRKISHHINI